MDLMGKGKKQIRRAFRLAVFERDKYKCVMCGLRGTDETLDAHHITDRNLMLHGGYVKENGITLCAPCHKKAEEFHETMSADTGWYPLDLYARIGSSLKLAQQADLQGGK